MAATRRDHTDGYSLVRFPPVSSSPRGIIAAPAPHEALQDQQTGLAQAPMKPVLFFQFLACMKPCMHPPGGEFLSPPVLCNSCDQPHWPGGSSSQCQSPRLEEPDVGHRILTPLRRTSVIYLFSSLWVDLLAGMGFDCIINVFLLPLTVASLSVNIVYLFLVASSIFSFFFF